MLLYNQASTYSILAAESICIPSDFYITCRVCEGKMSQWLPTWIFLIKST